MYSLSLSALNIEEWESNAKKVSVSDSLVLNVWQDRIKSWGHVEPYCLKVNLALFGLLGQVIILVDIKYVPK